MFENLFQPFAEGLLNVLPGGAADAFGGETGIFTNPTKAWDNFKNGKTNEVNQEIAEENLDYQRERNEIEDARYEDETTYNRAFQEDERAYQRAFAEEQRDYDRALQQQIFDREDTALERQASSLSKLGINPLSQNMSGLGAGQALQSSLPGSASAPAGSSRGGSALHNDFKMQDQGMLPLMSSMLSLADTINGATTGKYQRDSLALQNDKQFLDNLREANKLGINYYGLFGPNKDGYIANQKNGNEWTFYTPEGKELYDTSEFKSASYSGYREDRKNSMPGWQYTLDSLGNDDIYKQSEKALTNMSKLFDKVSENVFDKNNYSINPFKTLLNIFGLNF